MMLRTSLPANAVPLTKLFNASSIGTEAESIHALNLSQVEMTPSSDSKNHCKFNDVFSLSVVPITSLKYIDSNKEFTWRATNLDESNEI